MGSIAMRHQQMILNFSAPPTVDDLSVLASSVLDTLPDELMEFCADVSIVIEDIPDELLENELDLDHPYDLLALFKSGKELSPGVEKKGVCDDDCLVIFRRPLLDVWCENGEDLTQLTRRVMIEELGHVYDFSEAEIEEMIQRHYQGML